LSGNGLAALVKEYLDMQATGRKPVTPIQDTGSFQPQDPATVMIADGLRRVLQDRDLRGILGTETDPDRLRLFLLADCFLQYHTSPVRQNFLSAVRKGASLEQAASYISTADFVAATMQRMNKDEVIERLQSEGNPLQIAARIPAYLL